jgi:biotin carboxyl carrier protein
MILEATLLGLRRRVEVRGGDGRYRVSVDGTWHAVTVSDAAHGLVALRIGSRSHEVGIERRGGAYHVVLPGDSLTVELAEPARNGELASRAAHGPARVTAPMPGRVVRLLSAPGADVAAGQGLVVIEAMKMENELRAPRAGRVQELPVREGQAVEAGALLAVVG